MKKLLASILAFSMLLSTTPSFASEKSGIDSNIGNTGINNEISVIEYELPENHGFSAEIGTDLYIIEEDGLYVSINYGRESLFDEGNISWLVEENGVLYWAKSDMNNTYIYKKNINEDEIETVIKLYVPVECFDVFNHSIYYLYNNEIKSINLHTSDEYLVSINKDIESFYLDENGEIIGVTDTIYKDGMPWSVSLMGAYGSYDSGHTASSGGYTLPLSEFRPGSYFSKNGSACSLGGKKMHKQGSGSCVYGTRTMYYNGAQYTCNCLRYYNGVDLLAVQCLGFANWVQYKLFGAWSGNKFTVKSGSQVAFTSKKELKNIFASVPLGSHIRTNTNGSAHSLIFMDCNDSYIWTYEGNVDGYCGVQVVKRSWDDMYTYLTSTKPGISSITCPKSVVANNKVTNSDTASGDKPKENTQNTNKTPSVVQKKINVNWTQFPSEIEVGQSFPLRGSISSNYPIYYVSAILLDNNGNSVIPNIDFYASGTKNINIDQNHVIDSKMTFNKIPSAGTYKIRIIVNCNKSGSQDNIWFKDYPFTVKAVKIPAPAPTISVRTIEEGQQLVLKCSDTNTTIRYRINNGSEQVCSSGKTINYTSAGTYNVEAWATGSGYTSSPHEYKTFSVEKVARPSISGVTYGETCAWVTISGNGSINYTTNGTTPSKNSTPYRGTIEFENATNTTIKAIASQYGKVNSDIAVKDITISKPNTPTNVTRYNTKEKIAQGKTATIKWDRMSRATSYIARLYFDGEIVKEYETKGTKASFTLSEVGEYSITVSAKNFVDESDECSEIVVESMAPVTVTFVDKIIRRGSVDDAVVEQIQENINAKYEKEGKENPPLIEGNVIAVQTIDYDSKPSIPSWEDKPGFNNDSFSSEAYQNITEDTTAYALYTVRSYDVEFWNDWRDYAEENGKIGATQNILYSFSAEVPTDINVPTGYTLAGWNVDPLNSTCFDYTFVEGDMRLYTSYAWENEDLPVVLEILSAKRGNTCQSYEINLKYINNNLTDTQARIIVTLYTADNKVVYTATEDIDLMARDLGLYYTETIQATYADKISKISAVMVQVNDDKTGGAVSEMKTTTDIEFPTADAYWDKWSEWSTTEPGDAPAYKNDVQGVEREIESKTQYRYRDLLTKTSSSSSLYGWTRVNKKRTSWGSTIGPVYSNPSNNERNVWSEEYIISSNYKTVYKYYRYADSQCATWGSSYPDYKYYYEYSFSSPLTKKSGTSYSYKLWCNCGISDGYHTVYSVDWQGHGSYPESVWDSYNKGTRWYYQEPVYTYYYEKLDDWSAWSDTYHSGDDTDDRVVYRYRDKFNSYEGYDPDRDSQLEEETKETYELSGNILGVESDYSGKLATVLVYKKTNSDPTQEQLQYVDQITLGENNSYSFVVNPKEELNYEETGDYIVTLSIEGSDKLTNIAVIKAPVPKCIVTFQDDDGTILKDANGEDLIIGVDKGGSLDVNDISLPQKEGHRFVKWDTSLININSDIVVTPIYEKKVYNVVFVDHAHETADMVETYYGEPAALPDVEPIEGKVFIGWDLECFKFATEGNIDTAIYDYKEEIPYYLTTDGEYILTTEYNSETHTLVDETEYYKYISTNKAITESKIVTADWDILTYKVEFCDFNGNVVKEEMVAYGESATPPAQVEEGGISYAWDLTGSEWWNVKSDMVIYPYIPQVTNVDAPTISVPTGDSFGVFTVELESNVENGKIYYATDFAITELDAKMYISDKIVGNSESTAAEQPIALMSETIQPAAEELTEEQIDIDNDPDMSSGNVIEEYTGPIEIYAGAVVYAFTVDANGNISPISVFQYNDNYDEDNLGIAPNEYVPETTDPQITMPTIKANAGDTVTVPVNIANNMGITRLDLILGYNAENLTLESVENGDVFANSEFTYDVREDGSCKFTWETSQDNANNGILMNLTFTVNEDTAHEKHLLDLSVDYSADENEEEWYFVTVPGAITNEVATGTLGDVNGDEEADFSDAILILKHDVGITSLNEGQAQVADVNGDGEVDFADAILILQLDVGLIDKLPIQ